MVTPRHDNFCSATTSTSLILVVSSEIMWRISMIRGLGGLSGIEVVDAGNVKEARTLIDALAPRLLITQLDLPDGSGVEIIAALRQKQRNAVSIVIAADAQVGQQLASVAPGIEICSDPSAIDRLRAIVSARLDLPHLEHRDDEPFVAADYIQLACNGRHSVALTLNRAGQPVGRILVRLGEIWSAQDDEGIGINALRRLLFRNDTHVDVRRLDSSQTGPRTIEGKWEQLVLDAARVHDESQRPAAITNEDDMLCSDITRALEELATMETEWEAPSIPPGPSGPATSSAACHGGAGATAAAQVADAACFETLVDEGVEALLSKRFEDAFRAFCQADAIQPGASCVAANLQRLRDMGYGTKVTT